MKQEKIRLSLLDLGIVAPGQDGGEVLQRTLRLAQLAERLGYERLWLAEHHEAHFCWTSPEVMLATLAQTTRHIGLGSAAVLLPLYSPLNVAEVYRSLAALSGGRVALGVCGGVPADRVALEALLGRDDEPAVATRVFADKLGALLRYLDNDFPPGHRFANGATPCFAARPPVWVMGSGFGTAELAAKSGSGYAYSLFHRASTQDPAITARFREHARVAPGSDQLAIALSCVVGETQEAAQAQRAQVESWIGGTMRVNIVGTASSCAAQVREHAERFGTRHVILFHMWHLEAPRVAALQSFADMFGLEARDA